MSNLIRWDPFREMMTLRTAMDHMFDNAMFGRREGWLEPATWDVSVDVAEKDDEYLVKASLPGINPDDLEITYKDNLLTIKGEVKEEKEEEKRHYHLRERRYGSFRRSISLPSSVKADDISATYEAGVLTLHLPKVEEAKPQRIKVKKGKEPKIIEGRAKEIASKN